MQTYNYRKIENNETETIAEINYSVIKRSNFKTENIKEIQELFNIIMSIHFRCNQINCVPIQFFDESIALFIT